MGSFKVYVCMFGFCNVWSCVCVGFVMCGCVYFGFCNVCVCVDFVMCGYVYVWVCNVWVFVCVGFVMCDYVYEWVL